MKPITSKAGETEMQPDEYAPDGPVRLADNAPDSRGRLNGDGSKSKIRAERPVYIDHGALVKRIEDLEAQVIRLMHAAKACEEHRLPLLQRSEPGPIDLDLLVKRVALLESRR